MASTGSKIRKLAGVTAVTAMLTLAGSPAWARMVDPGTLDPTFMGTRGKGYLSQGIGEALGVQPDGRTVVGSTFDPESGRASSDFELWRVDLDGAVDAEFAGGRTDFAGRVDRLTDVAIDPRDGSIVAVGNSHAAGGWESDVAIAWYSSEGSLEGSRRINLGPLSTHETASAVAIQPDGKIVVAGSIGTGPLGSFNSDVLVFRLNPDGTRDNTFHEDGEVRFWPADSGFNQYRATAVAIDLTGPALEIVVAGSARNSDSRSEEFLVLKLKEDGTQSVGFGYPYGMGFRQYDLGGWHEWANDVLVQPDGKIVVAGYSGPPVQDPKVRVSDEGARHGTEDSDFGALRLERDGSLDRTFRSSGKFVRDVGGARLEDHAESVAMVGDELWIVGEAETAASLRKVAIVRLSMADGFDRPVNGTILANAGQYGELRLDGGRDIAVQPASAPWWVRGKPVVLTGSLRPGSGFLFGMMRFLVGPGGGCDLVSTADDLTLTGSDGDDILCAGAGLQAGTMFAGGDGDDILVGAEGADQFSAGEGKDLILGWSGRDVLSGGGGSDHIMGGYDDDTLTGGPGGDILHGGPEAGTGDSCSDAAADDTVVECE